MRLIGALLMLSIAMSGASAACAGSSHQQDQALHVERDPGDVVPPINPSDYDAYRRGNGTASISGKILYTGLPGHTFLCETPNLYPDTPFTEWLLAKWAFNVDGKPMLRSGLVFPDDTGMHVDVPDYLQILGQTNRAIIDGHCQDFADYTYVWFDHVPAGKYFLVDVINHTVVAGTERTENATVYGPNGAAPGLITTNGVGMHPADGYIFGSARITLQAGKAYKIDSKGLLPVAHFLDG